MIIKISALAIFFACVLTTSYAQNKLSIPFTGADNNPLENVTVQLLRNNDSGIVKTALTDRSGIAEFENIPAGSFIIKASAISYLPWFSAPFTLQNQDALVLPAVSLGLNKSSSLTGVTVVATKPFIQRLNDRLVVNVENSIVNAGSTALEVLERSPGVTINSNDIINLKGKSGVIIMIDGKQTAMNASELITYLRGLPSSLVQQIDIITNPSAKYDAAGNAGIIDIRMKKNQSLGTNGTISTSYGQGIYPKSNSSISFNNRGKKTNLYGSAGYNYISWLNNLVLRRDFFNNGIYEGSYDQDNFIRRIFKLPSARLGFDYFISKKTVVGIVLSVNFNNTDRRSENNSVVLDPQQEKESSFATFANGTENSRNYFANINFKHSFDSTGREISVDADYSKFIQDWLGNYSAFYYDKNGSPSASPYIITLDQDGKLEIRSVKADYRHPLQKNTTVEAGVKTSYVTANNSVLFYDRSGPDTFIDSLNSNRFRYRENINAVYVSFKKEFKKISVQLGLRGEATHLQTNQIFTGIKLDRSYAQLFPSAFVTYNIRENRTIGISLSRRIDRPTYGQLNPFRIFVDPSFYASGDPNIRPQTTWSWELNFTKKQLNIELAYSRTKDLITYVLMPTPNRVTLQTAVNFNSQEYLGLTLTTPLKITKWWNSVNNVNLFYSRIKGFVAETSVDADYVNAIISTNNSLTISRKKGMNGEINFAMNTGNRNGVMKDRVSYGLSAGIQKTILKTKGTLRLNITDILWKTYPRFDSEFKTYREKLSAIRDTRVATLTFSYRFGNNKVQAARRRTTASEEERRRAGGN